MSLLYTLIRFLLVFLIFSFLLENGMRSVFFFCPTCFYLLIYLLLGFCGGSDGKESTCNAGDLSLIPELGRSPGEGKGYPLRYSGLENSMDCIVHGVAESDTTKQLSLSQLLFLCLVSMFNISS